MDRTEVTNAQYRQFVYYVRDSILRERLADPAYGGDESYKITSMVSPSPHDLTGLARSPRRSELQTKSFVPYKASTTPIPSQESVS